MTTLNEYQSWVKEAWKISEKQICEKDEWLFLLEELGEVAEAIRKINGNKKNKEFDADLEKEFGDILLSIITLAIRYNIDLEKAFEVTKESIEQRYIK